MTERPLHDPEPEWVLTLKQSYDLAQAQERAKVWQPRYTEFSSQSTYQITPSDRPGWSIHRFDYAGAHLSWMTRENVGDYLLFRLDMMERTGGSELEKEGQRQQAALGQRQVYEAGERILATRLAAIGMEVQTWGQTPHTEFRQINNALISDHPAQRRFLTPQQASLLQTLHRRAEAYNHPRQQRWTRTARGRKPGRGSM